MIYWVSLPLCQYALTYCHIFTGKSPLTRYGSQDKTFGVATSSAAARRLERRV